MCIYFLGEIASVDGGFDDFGGGQGIDMAFLLGFSKKLFLGAIGKREGRRGTQRGVSSLGGTIPTTE
jgi:hypothetical protein